MSDPLERLTTALADRYTIERELGSGGMATVYLAEDLKHRPHVEANKTYGRLHGNDTALRGARRQGRRGGGRGRR